MNEYDAEGRVLNRRSRRATLDDVAQLAGVSLATASRALSGHSVREVSRSKVADAARQLGYRADLAAQAVARGTSNIVAVIVDDLRTPLASAIARGSIAAANRNGLLVTMAGGDTHPGSLLAMLRDVRATRPRVIVIAASRLHDASIREDLVRELDFYEKAGGRVAIVGHADLPFDTYSFAERDGAAALARELVEIGYRRPLILAGTEGAIDLEERSTGLRDGFVAAGVDAADIRLERVGSDRAGGLDAVLGKTAGELLRFDLIACVDDGVASGVYAGLREEKLQVGPDIAVSGFGDHPVATALRPRLTTVTVPVEAMSARAIEAALHFDAGSTALLRMRMRESTPPRTFQSVTVDRDKATILDVARRAVSSVATVSRVLADPDGVNPLLRANVLAAVESVGFLSTGEVPSSDPETKQISVVVPGRGSHMHQAVIEGLIAAAAAAGYRTVVIDSLASSSAESDIILAARTESDAIVLCAPRMPAGELENLLPQLYPAVVIDRGCDTAAAQVAVDYAEGVQTIADHLVSLGHRRIAYLRGPEWSTTETERERGLRMFGRTHPEVVIEQIECGWSMDDGFSAWPAVRDSGASAVIAFNDQVAIGLLGRLGEEDVAVPGRLSVTGLDDIPFARFASPPLTTMSVPLQEVGASAWAALHSLLEGVPGRSTHLFEPRLVVRRSTGPVPVEL